MNFTTIPGAVATVTLPSPRTQGPGGEFKVKLIELAGGGGRWALFPHLEAFGEGTRALRQAIDAGLLDALNPVGSRDEFGRRLVALGFVDRSDAPIPGPEAASGCSDPRTGGAHD